MSTINTDELEKQFSISANRFRNMVDMGLLGDQKFLHALAKELPDWTDEDVWFDSNFDYIVFCVHVKDITPAKREAMIKHMKLKAAA